MFLPLSWTNPILDYNSKIFQFDLRLGKHHKISAIDAAIKTVNYICDNYSPPYNLCVSGGIDSQAMIYSWFISGKPFNCFSAIYNKDFNLYDLETLDVFAKQYGIKVTYTNFDLLNFLETEHEYYVSKYLCGSPHITTYMRIADMITEGTVIFSGNFLSKTQFKLMPPNLMGLYHYAVLSERSCVPFFFCETGELAFSFIEQEQNFANGYQKKLHLYKSNQFPVIAQELYRESKYDGESGQTGFEKVKEYFDFEENLPKPITIQDRVSRAPGQNSKRNFDLLYRNKFEAMQTNAKYIIYA